MQHLYFFFAGFLRLGLLGNPLEGLLVEGLGDKALLLGSLDRALPDGPGLGARREVWLGRAVIIGDLFDWLLFF